MDQDKAGATRPVILLVEDNKILLKTYEQMFASVKELRGFRLAAFETAWAAMEWLNALEPGDAPATIILDWVMEGMSGMDMLVAIRKDPHLAAIPVIMATAKMGRLEVAEALARGANDYIVKPINTKILIQKLTRASATFKAVQDTATPA